MQPPTRAVLTMLLASGMAGCATGPDLSTPPGSVDATATSAVASSAQPTTASATTPATTRPSLDRTAGWRDDLARIIPALERIHPKPYHRTPKDVIEASIGTVSDHVPTSTDDELMVGVLRAVAQVSANGCDGHTGVFPWGTGSYPVTSLPLRLWLFGDQLVIVDGLGPHMGLRGAVIEAIGGHPIAEVLAAVDPIIPRDNGQTVRLLAPRYLLIPEVLRGLHLAGDGPIRIKFTQPGARAEVDVEPIPMADYNAWAGSYGLHLPEDPNVRYLSRMGEDLWWEVLPDGETLYVQYNRVERIAPGEVADLGQALRDPDIARIVFDIRHNFGGEVPVVDTIMGLLDDPAVDQPGKLFLAIGRNTLSAGSLLTARVIERTDATLIGEVGAGCATFYGDTTDVVLPHSGLAVTIAGMLEVGIDPNDQRTEMPPDVEVELTLEEWLDGADPVLEAVVPAPP